MDEGFVNDIVKKQQRVRDDIRALREAIELLCVEVAGNSGSLRRIESFQAAQDEREARQVSITEDVTKIANSVVLLVEDLHRQIRVLTDLLEKLKKRHSTEATLDYALDRIRREE